MAWLPLLLALAGACAPAPQEAAAAASEPPLRSSAVVDSIFPIEEELRRFRAALPSHPDQLAEVASSREALVARFVHALARADLASLQGLALDPGEFAYLYYPFSRYTRPPYELSPGLLWFQVQNRSSRGLSRALQRFGGQPIRYVSHDCNPLPVREEENALWTHCEVELLLPSGETFRGRLFGSVIERDGRFKLLSYSNAL